MSQPRNHSVAAQHSPRVRPHNLPLVVLALASCGLSWVACGGDGEDATVATSGSGGATSSTTTSAQGGAGQGGAVSNSSSSGGGTTGSGGDMGSGGGPQIPACVKDGSLAPPSGGQTTFTISQKIDGNDVERRVILHVPMQLEADKCYPILFALHGNGGKPDGFVNRFGNQVQNGRFIGVYPEGHQASWNLGQEKSTADDVAFLEAAADELLKYGNVAHRRRYVVGWSNGAGLAHKLGIESQYFKAFAAIVTSLTTSNQPTAQSPKISVLQVMGENDQVVPYAGGSSPTGHTFEPAEASAQIWAQHNGCDAMPMTETTQAGNLRIAYQNCDDGNEVEHYKAAGAGHNIPNNFEGGLIKLVWNFLSKH